MKKNIINVLLLFLIIVLVGCSENFLKEDPPDMISSDNLYTNVQGFKAGLYGLYHEIRRERSGLENPTNQCFNAIMVAGNDIMYSNFPAGYDNIMRDWGTRSNPTAMQYSRTWEWLYSIINAANIIIIRSENSAIRWNEGEKNDIIAQAKLFRAWAYRHLTNLWGDVPLNLEESSSETIKDWVRNDIKEVWMQMEDDLLFAEIHLPATRPDNALITKGVATHYLAELYLTMGEYNRSIQKAESLINSGVYSLIKKRYGVHLNRPGVPFMDMFYDGNSNRSEGNTEALWVFQYAYNVPGGDGANIANIMRREYLVPYYNIKIDGKTPLKIALEYGGRGIGRQAPTRFMIKLYEIGDDRGSEHAWWYSYRINNPAGIPTGYKLGDIIRLDTSSVEKVQNPLWPSTRKWDEGTPPENVAHNSTFNDQIYLRLAETYLILAEAQLKNNNPEGAASTLNILRARANASPIKPGDVTIDFIMDERARELFCEEHRRYALLRNDKWLERTRLYNNVAGKNITERDTLLPIPQIVIDANLTIKMNQNPGY